MELIRTGSPLTAACSSHLRPVTLEKVLPTPCRRPPQRPLSTPLQRRSADSVRSLLSREEHSCAPSFAHSPPPSSRVEAVGQLRGRDAARLQCQPPRDVVALLHLAPSPLPLRVRRPAPFKRVCLRSHATADMIRATRREDASDVELHRPCLLHVTISTRDRPLSTSGLSTTRN